MAKYALGFSSHPSPQEAVGEAVGQVQQHFNEGEPQLVLVLVSGSHLQDFSRINKSVRTLLSPREYVGATAGSIISGASHLETGPGIAIWAADEEARVFRLGEDFEADLEILPTEGTLILLADPYTLDVNKYFSAIADSGSPENSLQVIGGLLSTQSNHLAINEELYPGGAVGIYFTNNIPVQNIVSQGFRPIGQPFTITGAEGNKITSIGGQPPIKRLSQVFNGLEPREREYLKSNLHIGIAIDENKLDIERGDFLIRAVTALQRNGEMNIAHLVEVGDLIQFQLLDPLSALEDLQNQLQRHASAAALMFTCNGRGSQLFGEPDMESNLVYSELFKNSGSDPVLVGMSCAGEFGPILNQNFLHGFTATLALFD